MEFWGVEVKNGAPLFVEPGKDMLVHISQIALGENTNNGKDRVQIYLKVGEQKLVIGNLSHGKLSQLGTEIVLEKGFELSHTWKNGSVFVTGYKVDAGDPNNDMSDSDDEVADVKQEPAAAISAVKQVNFKLPNEDVKAKQEDDDDSDDDESSEDDTSSEDEEERVTPEADKVTAEADSDEDDEDDSSDDDEDDSSDDDTPKKPEEASKKRPAEATTSKNSNSNKKAKFVTPQKTESKKPHVHVATPHPSKGAKNSGSSGEASTKQQQTPKSAGAFGCNSCNRTFTSENGLQSHTKAKHSAAA